MLGKQVVVFSWRGEKLLGFVLGQVGPALNVIPWANRARVGPQLFFSYTPPTSIHGHAMSTTK